MKKFHLLLIVGMFNGSILSESHGLFYNQASHNFIVRWGFQDLCDFVYDPCCSPFPTNSIYDVTFDPNLVKPGSIIFVREIDRFFKEVHPFIKHPYIIVAGGEMKNTFFKRYLDYLIDEKVIAWFGIEPGIGCEHPKFFIMPIGIHQDAKRYLKRNDLDDFFIKLRNESEKKYLLYLNFNDKSNDARPWLRDYFKDKNYCNVVTGRVSFKKYMQGMAESKFALSPPGDSPDCYRTWESLLAGSIPILIRSHVDSLYEGLPVLIIDKWEELNKEFLDAKYKEITAKKYDISKLYMEYWEKKIKDVRDKFLSRYESK